MTTAVPKGSIFREPSIEGKPGRLFTRQTLSFSAIAKNVRRSALLKQLDPASSWGERTISGDLEVVRKLALGYIDGKKRIVLVGNPEIRFEIVTNTIIGQISPSFLNNILIIYIVLEDHKFARLWSETMARPNGVLTIHIQCPAFVEEGVKPRPKGPLPTYYLSSFEAEEVISGGLVADFAIEDSWGS